MDEELVPNVENKRERTRGKMKEVFVLLYLLLGGIYDLRFKKIPLWYLLLFLIFGLLSAIFMRDISYLDAMFGFLGGVFMILIAKLSKESIGYGDGILLCGMGLFMGIHPLLYAFFYSICLMIPFSLWLLFFEKRERDEKVPLIPFLLFGTMIQIVATKMKYGDL